MAAQGCPECGPDGREGERTKQLTRPETQLGWDWGGKGRGGSPFSRRASFRFGPTRLGDPFSWALISLEGSASP